MFEPDLVAPYTGAWIEIALRTIGGAIGSSLPTRERGLKSKSSRDANRQGQSLPTRERGLKYKHIGSFASNFRRSLHGSVD